MKILALALVALLPGCSLMQPSPADMTASQMKEMVKDKSGSVVCATVMGPWGTGKTVIVNLDQNAIKDGGVAVDEKCTVTITSAAPPRVAPAPKDTAK
jgi:hypothetical protein